MGARSGPVPAGSNGLFVVFSMTDPFLALYCNKTAGQCLSHVGTEGSPKVSRRHRAQIARRWRKFQEQRQLNSLNLPNKMTFVSKHPPCREDLIAIMTTRPHPICGQVAPSRFERQAVGVELRDAGGLDERRID